MKKLKIKLLKAMIYLCDVAIRNDDDVELEEMNGMVATRNDLMRKLSREQACN